MASINYAKQYSQALANAYPYVLNFGALYNTENDNRYKWTGAKTIEIPVISTTGRVNANRDSIATATRNYDNEWEAKTLTNHRMWTTLIHPMDIDETNYVATIENITKTFNELQKFPEMDAYCVSKIYTDFVAAGGTKISISTKDTVLTVFDKMMLDMDNARVPANGRILYTTYETKNELKNLSNVQRYMNVDTFSGNVSRVVNRLDEVTVVAVPATLMKTAYDFTTGFTAGSGAEQIQMLLIHPSAVITPVKYEFSKLDSPSAMSNGKWVYYEESYEDVFILKERIKAIQFAVGTWGVDGGMAGSP